MIQSLVLRVQGLIVNFQNYLSLNILQLTYNNEVSFGGAGFG